MSLLPFLGEVMNNRDYLCYLIYMFAGYMFSDATLVNGRIDIYNEHNQIVLMIRVNGDSPDSVEFIKGDGKEAGKAVMVMNVLIDFLRMIHDKHSRPFNIITRLVSVSE